MQRDEHSSYCWTLLQHDEYEISRNDILSYFCSIHVHLQPSDPWEDGKTSLAYEDCKMKDNYEGDESSPSLLVSEPKINVDEGDIANDYKGYFGSD